MSNKSILFILDGWGMVDDPSVSAISSAKKPFFDTLWRENPHSTLVTFGEDVGLPEGQMGNSEVGHLNIGAGRVIYQELVRINRAIRDGSLARNETLLHGLNATTGTLHLMGLVSDGGVHSHIDHLIALARVARDHFKGKIVVHAFTDGRDVDPKSGYAFLKTTEAALLPLDIAIATVTGRYYAMDRDKRWERTRLAYDALVHGTGKPTRDILSAVQSSYDDGVTDEFIKPTIATDQNGNPVATIQQNDTVLFFNFRTDRPRQLTEVLTQTDHPDQAMHTVPIRMITMTQYDSSFQNLSILFPETDIRGTLGEYLSAKGKTQLRVAETEKYPHVTYFFSGGREQPFTGEDRILIPSPKVATYDLQPEMSAIGVTDAVVDYLQKKQPDFICLNFANTDMVGHTGVFKAAVQACETVDQCLSRLVPLCRSLGYAVVIIADHGNADTMINPDGSPNTAHTKNPVPFICMPAIDGKYSAKNGRLADIAPTLLFCMGLPVPDDMTGDVLIEKM